MLDPIHRDMLGVLGYWLRKEMNSQEDPLRLATRHLGEHGLNRLDCKLCGAAKAIVDCFCSLQERAAYNLVETIRKSQQDLVAMKGRIEKHVASFCEWQLEKERDALKSKEEVADVLVLQPNQAIVGRVPRTTGSVPTPEGTRARLESMGPLEDALRKVDPIVRTLATVERRIAEGMVIASLAERRDRWPPHYVETKVDCYLMQHGWTPREIYPLHHACEASKPRDYAYIGDRVRRAKKTKKPPLIWGWPNEKNEKEGRRLLDLILAKIAQQYDSRN